MAKYKCKKCGSTDFVAKAEDEYFMELDLDDDNFLTVNIVDQYVLGDVMAIPIVCQKCGTREDTDPDDCEWDWSEVD